MLFSYCTNIHPGETWEEIFAALKTHTTAVRDRVRSSPTDPFPLGLRLSAEAAHSLDSDPALLRKFQHWMEDENMLAYTINGFPYGRFHGTRVKEQVYAPDWSTQERLDYTRSLFRILARILPQGAEGSVSTVPGSFKAFVANQPERLPRILENLRTFAEELDKLSNEYEIDFHLGLEPEPLGLLENTADTLAFFDKLQDGLDASAKERLLRRIGINYDTCHFAVEYEKPDDAIAAFIENGIRLSKIHLSNALTLNPNDDEAIDRIRAFTDDTYLHQVIIRQENGKLERFIDLPQTLAALDAGEAKAKGEEWRIHYHIPLYCNPQPPLNSTADHLTALAAFLQRHPNLCRHFEMETYTFHVLPDEMKRTDVVDMLAEEFRWCENTFFKHLI